MRASLKARNAVQVLRAVLSQQGHLERDTFLGPRMKNAHFGVWAWAPLWMFALLQGHFDMGQGLVYDFDEALFKTFWSHNASTHLEMWEPHAEDTSHRVIVGAATADEFATLLCTHLDTPAEGCLNPEAKNQVLVLALALEGYSAFFRSPGELLVQYMQSSTRTVIKGVSPRGTVVPFRNPQEFSRALEHMMTHPDDLERFLGLSQSTRQSNMLGAQPKLPNVFDIAFDEAGLYSETTTALPRQFSAWISATHGLSRVKTQAILTLP